MAKQKIGFGTLPRSEGSSRPAQSASDDGEDTLPTARLNPTDVADIAAENLDTETKTFNAFRHEGSFIYLTIPSSGRRVKFKRTYIIHRDLDTILIDENNIRIQEGISEDTIEEHLPDIRKSGVIFDALATRENGKFNVFDGSLRKFGAKITGHGLPLLYTEEHLSDDDKAVLSRIANIRAATSLYEKGRHYKKKMERHGVTGVNGFAEAEGINKATMSFALRAAEIPLAVYALFPGYFRQGRDTIQAILRAWDELTNGQRDELLEKLKNQPAAETQNEAKHILIALVADVLGSPSKKPASEPVSVGSYQFRRKKKSITISAESPELIDKIEKLIREMS